MTDKNLPVEQKSETILDLVTEIKDGDIVHVKACKLCNSKFRSEAEEHWETKRRNSSATARFLQDKGEDISDRAVSNHMWDHYMVQQKSLAVKNYAQKLKFFEKAKTDRLADVAMTRAVLIKELLEIGEVAERQDIFERRKTAELLIKLVAQIIAVDESEKRFYDDWKPAKIVIEKLTQIISLESETAPKETKQLMARVVDTLWHSVEGIKVDK